MAAAAVTTAWWKRRPSIPPPKVDDEAVRAEALALLEASPALPKLVVFDLDHTLWPFQCDRFGSDRMPYLYPDARGIINALKDKGVDMALASRASARIAKSFLDKLGILNFFAPQEIFYSWTPKTEHFQRIKSRTGLPYQSMLFFDDEVRNIQAVSKLGVHCVYLERGITVEKLELGLSNYAKAVAVPADVEQTNQPGSAAT